MKEGKKRAAPDKRLIGMGVAGVLLGRVWLFQINPFGPAFFAAMCAERKGRKLTAFAVMAGMFTGAQGISLLKYMVLFSMMLILERFREREGKTLSEENIQNEKGRRGHMTALILSFLCAGMNLLLGALNSFMSVNTWNMLWLGVLESVSIFALANIYQWGVHFFLCEDWSKIMENEELVSVLVLTATALYGIPRAADNIFSVSGTLSYLMVLFMGYRYGAATGAIAGAAGGVLAAVCADNMVMIGIYCLLGVSVGVFRRLGRIGGSIAFTVIGWILIWASGREMAGIIELRAMASAVIIFLAIPRRIACIADSREEETDNLFAKKDIRELANGRLEDFSNAFRRLAKSFEGGAGWQKEISEEDVERVFEDLSEKICSGCANCNYCWSRHYEETSLNIHNILWQAGRDGTVSVEKISPDFGRRCLRLETYVENAEDRMAVAQMNMGWRNRIAESREIMGRQMLEVASALKAFTLELYDVGEVAAGYKREMMEELKKEGVRLKYFSVKKKRGRLEVVFTGACHKNRCLTKTDVAEALSRAAGVSMCPDRETRNVLSGEETTMFFREDTRFKALTGLARVAKFGESVSGDNYSFLELQSGELLMVLADGMGSGEAAYRDSENLIETLENLMEAGFEKKSALRLLNTLFVANYEGKSFTTLDMTSINLYTGRCEIVKNGAAATFIRRPNGVETILSEALPVGVDMEAESDVAVRQVQEGDMVIMVSDGVIDGFYGGRFFPENEENELECLIGELSCQNPDDMANQILMNALARSSREATDDMSVLVAGIWNKN